MNSFGNNIKLELYGGSHDERMGCAITGLPAGAVIDRGAVDALIKRRSASRGGVGATARHEADLPEILSGAEVTADKLILNGETLRAEFANSDPRKADYGHIARPSHADYVSFVKYGSLSTGGGMSSGRITLPMTFAGGVCASLLMQQGVNIVSHVLRIGSVWDARFDPMAPRLESEADPFFPLADASVRNAMESLIVAAREAGDTVSCECECAVTGLPVGVGEPVFCGLESELAHLLFAIPGVRRVEFGDACGVFGSSINDQYTEGGRTLTNRSGGVNGGLSNGMPLVFTCGFRPVPSIKAEQTGFDLLSLRPAPLRIAGRHDTCILPRGLAAVEAAAAICVYDLMRGII